MSFSKVYLSLWKEGDLKIVLTPPPLKKLPEILLMTSHLEGHMTSDVKPDMLSGVQTGNGIPHDRCNIRGIAHARTEETTFSCKDD